MSNDQRALSMLFSLNVIGLICMTLLVFGVSTIHTVYQQEYAINHPDYVKAAVEAAGSVEGMKTCNVTCYGATCRAHYQVGDGPCKQVAPSQETIYLCQYTPCRVSR